MPSYALRLQRRFGSQPLGWQLVTAFSVLALLHLVWPWERAGAGITASSSLVYLFVPLLLLIGLAHTEAVLKERLQSRQQEQKFRSQLERQFEAELTSLRQSNEALQREIARRCQTEQALKLLPGRMAARFDQLFKVVEGFASLLQARLPQPAAAGLLKGLATTLGSASALNRQLLAVTGRPPIKTRRLDLNRFLEQRAWQLKRVFGERPRLYTNYQPGLPPVLADPVLLDEILAQLLANALEAMPRGGSLALSTAEAEVDAASLRSQPQARPGHFVRLSLYDTGGGMTPQVQARLGEPFFTTKDQARHTGLGLAVVDALVQHQGGWLHVSSQPRVGTAVRIFLPVA